MNKLLLGILYGLIAQVLTFLQLQGGIKYHWNQKYPILIILASMPISFIFIKSVGYMVEYSNGGLWLSRLVGFVVGVFVFSILSSVLFKEPITSKTIVCLLLAFTILLIQIFVKG
jgi:hypothetical protein